jgi:hypothetical protein
MVVRAHQVSHLSFMICANTVILELEAAIIPILKKLWQSRGSHNLPPCLVDANKVFFTNLNIQKRAKQAEKQPGLEKGSRILHFRPSLCP